MPFSILYKKYIRFFRKSQEPELIPNLSRTVGQLISKQDRPSICFQNIFHGTVPRHIDMACFQCIQQMFR